MFGRSERLSLARRCARRVADAVEREHLNNRTERRTFALSPQWSAREQVRDLVHLSRFDIGVMLQLQERLLLKVRVASRLL